MNNPYLSEQRQYGFNIFKGLIFVYFGANACLLNFTIMRDKYY